MRRSESSAFRPRRATRRTSETNGLPASPTLNSPWQRCIHRCEHDCDARSSERRDRRMSLVLEDPGGEPLDRLLGRPLDVTGFLRIAIPLAVALRRMHARGLIHKDVKPANVLVDRESRHAWLTGFGIASRLPREHRGPEPPEVIAGTLAYMAPEQTGRMNRSVDSRSDLYALGVSFYEMLTGTLPFTAADPMEWVHCHIARQPVPPDERVAGIPGPLSAIAMKLLAKTAEDRYQTAAGVEADLRRCLAAGEAHRRIDPFPLAAHDVSDWLVIRRLLGVFARPQHPLVLFLDDLQWLDAATLELIEHLVTEPEVRHLLLVGAYRDNEVDPSHPLMRTLGMIRKA